MTDLEKAIQWLEIERECVVRDCDRDCGQCDLAQDLETILSACDDVISLLKAQQPRIMTLEEVLAWAETLAEKRDPVFFEQKKGKGPSGWICNSLCPKDYYLCCLDGDARCWTSRPTDEQRKAAKWE